MKIAVTGKGGVGKTTLSSTLACIFSQKYKVFAIDADPDMNLASSLGIREKITPISNMKDLIKDRTGAEPGTSFGGIFKINPKISDLPESLSINYDSEGRLKLLVMGTVDKGGDGCICPASVLLKAILRHMILKKDEIIILDMEAGIEHLGRKTAESVDIMIVVVEPGLKSLETAFRIKKLAAEIGIENVKAVLNKIAHIDQEKFIQERLKNLNIKVLGSIPYDQNVISADMEGRPLTEYIDSPAREAIEKIADNILKN